VAPHQLWPDRHGIAYQEAVLLECEPEDLEHFRPTSEQEWPRDAIRYASTLGLEPQLRSGVPRVGRSVLSAASNWHYLALGFDGGGEPADRMAWAACRAALLESYVPSLWPGPPECETILVITEADYGLLMVRDKADLERWLSTQLTTAFANGSSHQGAARAAHWCLTEAWSKGVHLTSVESHGSQTVVRGHWGRSSDVHLTVGDEAGDALELTVS
jgi:hypothetical protein